MNQLSTNCPQISGKEMTTGSTYPHATMVSLLRQARCDKTRRCTTPEIIICHTLYIDLPFPKHCHYKDMHESTKIIFSGWIWKHLSRKLIKNIKLQEHKYNITSWLISPNTGASDIDII